MTSRERLHRLHRQEEVDRPGLFVRGVSERYPVHDSYEALRRYVREHGDLKEIVSIWEYTDISGITRERVPYSEDYEKIISTMRTPAGTLTHERLDSTKGLPGYDVKHYIETERDAEIYMRRPAAAFRFDGVDFGERADRMGDRGIVVTEINSNPLSLVVNLMGSELFAIWSLEKRELLHSMVAHERDILMKMIKTAVESGAGPYFGILGQEYMTPPLHGPRDFYDFNVIYDRPISDLIHNAGGYLHIHCHGPIKHVLPFFIDIGTDVLHPIEPPPLGDVTPEEAKAVLRGKVCIEGNIQIGDMYDLTPGEIREQTEALIKGAFDDNKGLIVCPTASPFVRYAGNCAENYFAMMNTVLEYR